MGYLASMSNKREMARLKELKEKPVWKISKKEFPHCPKCDSILKRAYGDYTSICTWMCGNCGYFY